MLAPNWKGVVLAAELLFRFPNKLLAGAEADAALLFWPKPANALVCGVGAALKSPPDDAEVDTLLSVLPNKLEAGVLDSLLGVAPNVKGLDADALDVLFCEAPKAGGCDCCAPKVKLLPAGVEAPKLVLVLPKFKSGFALKGDIEPLVLLLLLPKPELAGGKDAVVEFANALDADCAGGKLLVELLPKLNAPPLDASCCCGCPNVNPPDELCGAGADCAKGFEALGSGPKLNAFAVGGLLLKAERPCARWSATVRWSGRYAVVAGAHSGLRRSRAWLTNSREMRLTELTPAGRRGPFMPLILRRR